MAQTFRDRRLALVGISVGSYLDDGGGERIQEGDLVAIARARPNMHIGTGDGQRCRTLWLYLQHDAEIDEIWNVTEPNMEGDVWFDKRRYCIPLETLQQAVPSIDLARVRDPLDCYQPCVGGIDQDIPESYRFDEIRPLLEGEGMSFAKRSAIVAFLEDAIITKRLRRRGRLDQQKLDARQVFRLDDGTFALTVVSACGYFMDATPHHIQHVSGLVFDKATGRYL